MWARVLNGQLVEIIYQPKAMVINDIQHPKTIFTRAWTNEERKVIGILLRQHLSQRLLRVTLSLQANFVVGHRRRDFWCGFTKISLRQSQLASKSSR